MNILDIDLDFFVDNIAYDKDVFSIERLPSEYYHKWSNTKVIQFLKNNCGLKGKKIRGKLFNHHHEAFTFLKNVFKDGMFVEIDHVDAHSDLGLGDVSCEYISTELLKHPVEERPNHIKVIGSGKNLTPGNFLAFAIACRWISKLNYIHPKNKATDLPWFHFKDFNLSSEFIQLKHLSRKDFNTVFNNSIESIKDKIKSISLEPEVQFTEIPYYDFKSTSSYDYILLTKSPGFTPIESDNLIPIISEFIKMF